MPQGTALIGGRVLATSPTVLSKTVTATLAQINAGYTFLVGVGAVRFKVVGFLLRVTGLFADATDIRLSSTAATPVDIATVPIADAADGAKLVPETANVVLGAGFNAALAAGKGVQIRKTGSAATGGTSITIDILYEVASGVNVGAQAA